MPLRINSLHSLLGGELHELWVGGDVGQRRVSCVTTVDGMDGLAACREGELVLFASADAVACSLELMQALTLRRVTGVLIPWTERSVGLQRLIRLAMERRIALGMLAHDADRYRVANTLNRALAPDRLDPTTATLHSAATLQELAEVLGRLIGNSVTIETPQHELLAFSPTLQAVDRPREETILHRHANSHILAWVESQGYMAAIRKSDHPIVIPGNPDMSLSTRIALRVAAEGEVLAIIWAMDSARPLGGRDYAILEEAAEAAAGILKQQREVANREAELRAEFLEDIVEGRITSPENIRALARSLGWHVDRPQQALVIVIDDFEGFRLRHTGRGVRRLERTRERLVEIVRLEAMTLDPDALVGLRSTGIIALIAVSAGDEGEKKATALRLAERIVRRVAALLPDMTVTVGIGRDVPSFEHMAQSLQQAEMAADLGSSLWAGNRAVHYDDLGVHRMLFTLAEHDGMIPPALQRIIDHDQRHHSDYVQTLAAYFACQGRLRAAALQLGIHRNTLEYRLRRIQEVSGVSLDDPNNRLALELGIKLEELQRTTTAFRGSG